MKLMYPMLVGRRYRWCEASNTGDPHAISPCKANECDGHSSQHEAALHHAMWFCTNTGITYQLLDERKACHAPGCTNWTPSRAAFIGCPYEDYIPCCMGHDIVRTLLTVNHMLRRDLKLQWQHNQVMNGVPHIVLPVADYDEQMENMRAQEAQTTAG